VIEGRDEVAGKFGEGDDADVGGALEVGGGVDADEGVVAVVVCAPVGFSGNCCVSVGDACPPVAPEVVGSTIAVASAVTQTAMSARPRSVARSERRFCALSEGHTSAPHPRATLSG
jgi:hypothetical protein